MNIVLITLLRVFRPLLRIGRSRQLSTIFNIIGLILAGLLAFYDVTGQDLTDGPALLIIGVLILVQTVTNLLSGQDQQSDVQFRKASIDALSGATEFVKEHVLSRVQSDPLPALFFPITETLNEYYHQPGRETALFSITVYSVQPTDEAAPLTELGFFYNSRPEDTDEKTFVRPVTARRVYQSALDNPLSFKIDGKEEIMEDCFAADNVASIPGLVNDLHTSDHFTSLIGLVVRDTASQPVGLMIFTSSRDGEFSRSLTFLSLSTGLRNLLMLYFAHYEDKPR